MATITTYSILPVDTLPSPSVISTGRVGIFGVVEALTPLLVGASISPGTGMTPRIVVMPTESVTVAPTTVRRLRGWHTVNASNVTWLEGAATPSGVATETITVTGTVSI